MTVCNEDQAASNRLAAIVESSDDAIIGEDLNGIITSWNHGAEKIFGYTAVEMVGTTMQSLIPLERQDEERNFQKKVERGESVNRLEVQLLTKDGRKIYISGTISPIKNRDGEVIGLAKVGHDITDIKKLLIESNRLAAIVEFSDDAIIGEDLNGIITSWNHGAEKIFGYTAVEMVGTTMQSLIPLDQRDQEEQILKKISHSQVADHFVTKRITKSGPMVDVSITISPIKNSEYKIIGTSKVARDISFARRAVQENHRLNMTLKQGFDQQTLSLALSDKRLRLSTEAAQIGIWDWNLETNKVHWDRLMFEIYGMIETSDGVIPYTGWTSRVHPDDVEDQEASLRRICESGGTNQRVFRIIRDSDGAIRTIHASDASIAGADGKTTNVVGINHDITESIMRMEEIRLLNLSLHQRTDELFAANQEKSKRVAALVIANEEKTNRAAELVIANEEKAKRAAELVLANEEKAKRVAALDIANLQVANNENLRKSLMQTIDMATKLGELRDPYTAGHEKTVGQLAKAIAKQMGLDEHHQEGLMIAGFLHDIGKVVVPVELLCKPGKITPEEFNVIKCHVLAGYDLLKDVDFPWPIVRPVLEHHERLDGSGYPNHLKADQIGLDGRILAVADVIDAITSYRPYRPAMGIENALAEIKRGRGSLYDEIVVDACLQLFLKENLKDR